MQTYQSTPDFYRDYIAHYTSKIHFGYKREAYNHKYISRRRGPNGKWIYEYPKEIRQNEYREREGQIKDSRKKTEQDTFMRKQNQKERRRFAYSDRARQIKEGRDRASAKAFNDREFSPEVARYIADRSGYKSKWTDKRLKVHDRITANESRFKAKERARTKKILIATTKGYGKYSTRPSKDALKKKSQLVKKRNADIKWRLANASARARKNRKSK